MGVELELQLINTVDFDLTSAANDLLELLSRKPFPGTVTPEMTQSMIEIATGIRTAHTPLLAELRGMRDSLVAACERLNIDICGVGTHPFQRWSEQRVFFQAQVSGNLVALRLFGEAVHRVWPACSHWLCIGRRRAFFAALAEQLCAALHCAERIVPLLTTR